MMISPMSDSAEMRRRKFARLTRMMRLSAPVRALTRLGRSLKRLTSPVNSPASCSLIRFRSPWRSRSKISIQPSSTKKKSTPRSPRLKRTVSFGRCSSVPERRDALGHILAQAGEGLAFAGERIGRVEGHGGVAHRGKLDRNRDLAMTPKYWPRCRKRGQSGFRLCW